MLTFSNKDSVLTMKYTALNTNLNVLFY